MSSNNSGNNVPILFLHGLFGSKEDWRSYLDHPSCPKDSAAIDLPGHGELANDDVSVEAAFSHMLDNLPDSNRLGIHLVGYSLGGRLALQFALSYPQFIHKLTLISAHPGLATDAEREARKSLDTERAASLLATWPDFLTDWYKAPMWSDFNTADVFEAHLNSRKQNNASAMAKSIEAYSLSKQKTLAKLNTHCPFQIDWVTGEKDSVYTKTIADLAENSDKITHSIVENSGHACITTHPDYFKEKLFGQESAQ